MFWYFAAHPLTYYFILKVLLGYTVILSLNTVFYYILTRKLEIGSPDLYFAIPTFDKMLEGFVSVVLYAPLVEELLFRGLPSIFFGVVGIIAGTIVWAAAHLPSRVARLNSYPLRVQKLAALVLFVQFLAMGIYFSWLWIIGAGLIAVIMHFINNALVFAMSYIDGTKKQTDLFEERKEKKKPKEEPIEWVDSNPPPVPFPLEPIKDPKHFKVLVEDNQIKVKEEEKEPAKPKVSLKPKPAIKPATSKVAEEIRESRMRIRQIEAYIKEKYH